MDFWSAGGLPGSWSDSKPDETPPSPSLRLNLDTQRTKLEVGGSTLKFEPCSC